MTRDLLFLFSDPPYRSQQLVETLESALVAAAFDQRVSVLFRDAAIWALVRGQDGAVLGRRTIGRMIAALAQYDIESVFVCSDALAANGLDVSRLVIDARPLSRSEQAGLIAAQHAVFT
jgi:tRNA 2-thiouridine synthesizing protein C